MINESISAIVNDLRRPQTTALEPGLLSVFQMMTSLQIGLALIAFITTNLMNAGLPFHILGSSLVWTTVLLIYLSWPGLHERMGEYFLPPALLFGAVMPMVDRIFLLRFLMTDVDATLSFGRIEDSSWRMVVFLLFPLILTAWQYRMKHVLLYIIGTSLVGLGLTGWIFGWDSLVFSSTWPVAIPQSILLFLIGYVVVRMISAQRDQRSLLTDANEQLAQYASTVDQLATSRERNRLARELHDTLSHTLSSLSVQLEAADSVWTDEPEQARALLVKSIANTRSGLAETRRALQDLRASPLEDLGLGLALRNLAESMSKRAGVRLLLDVPKQIEGLSDAQEQCIYRIAQEALENVIKHANAHELEVVLNQNVEDRWQLTIRDDGQGFDENLSAKNGHFGLQGMKERAAMIGGALRVDSQLGKGAEIRLVL